jgi:hypothetical protein
MSTLFIQRIGQQCAMQTERVEYGNNIVRTNKYICILLSYYLALVFVISEHTYPTMHTGRTFFDP